MTKNTIGMVTRNISHLVIVIISDEVVKMNILLLHLDRHLFSVVRGNRYLPRDGKENVLSTTITGDCNYVQIGITSSNYTIFGFCHDPLNSLNSVTFI